MPLEVVLPRAPVLPERLLPLEEQETSYLALSARISRRCSRERVIMVEMIAQVYDRKCQGLESKSKTNNV
jgi:hypothetical protein